MNNLSFVSFAGAAVCVVLAVGALLLKRRSIPWLCFGVGMTVLAADSIFCGLTLAAASTGKIILWQKFKLIAAAFLPATWLMFSLCYSRGNYREFLARWRIILIVAYVIPLAGVIGSSEELIGNVSYNEAAGKVFIGLGLAGRILNLGLLAGSILILMNLERTFRSAVGIMRWRIKYFIFGAALLFGAELYTSSQALLYSGIHGVSLQISSVATLVASVLMVFSLVRTKLAESEIYPSHKVLQHSFTAVLAGMYLVCVGVLANLVARIGGDPGFPVKALLLMVMIVGLTVAVLSDRVRQQIKLFVSRNFRRPIHDYRKVWSAFTERTGSLVDQTELCRAVVKLISETFELLSVTVWSVHEHDKSLIFAASTSLTEERAEQLMWHRKDMSELLQSLRSRNEPFDIDKCREKSVELLKDLNPDYFGKGGNRICVPLVSGGEVVGLITVADRVNGLQFSVEDLDLLKCIGDQVAGSLRNIQLSRKLMQNKELEAFQTMSAFFVHDLKNTASALSLMLQNLSAHFGDPGFRDDCLRGLSRSVAHLNELIRRLTLLRHELELKKTEIDLNELVSSAINDLEGIKELTLVKDFQHIPKILADPEQLRKVVLNLVLNAKEAVNDSGEIRLRTAQENGWAVLSVADNGCGMTKDFVRGSLFKAFQTTKQSGLGIGMFHTKAIVDAHCGQIEVESQPGKGTTFRVLLPSKGQSSA
jgi:putative PEP-CTERM system histidine kinase